MRNTDARSRRGRRFRRFATAALVTAGAATAGAAAVAWATRDLRFALGSAPSGTRAERVWRSPQFRDGAFHNSAPATILAPGTGWKTVRDLAFEQHKRKPTGVIPIITPPDEDGAPPPADVLRAIWYGHSSVLVEMEGRRVLFDPVWSERCSPSAR